MLWCDTLTPSFFKTPDICRGDHCSSMMVRFILHTSPGASAALDTERFRRSMALSCALNQTYLPDGLPLRFNSRESVDWLMPTICAISFLGLFLWSKAKICDLCSKINWWYICNTKLVNLWETSVSFFYLYCWLFLFPLREADNLSLRIENVCISRRGTLFYCTSFWNLQTVVAHIVICQLQRNPFYFTVLHCIVVM